MFVQRVRHGDPSEGSGHGSREGDVTIRASMPKELDMFGSANLSRVASRPASTQEDLFSAGKQRSRTDVNKVPEKTFWSH